LALYSRRLVELAASAGHTCALLENGDIRCWGSGGFGALGYGTPDNVGDDETPDQLPPVRYR
jgi:alpha-tubulin suppressor-like RCC1 family protein